MISTDPNCSRGFFAFSRIIETEIETDDQNSLKFGVQDQQGTYNHNITTSNFGSN
jgi:hypothetical protein